MSNLYDVLEKCLIEMEQGADVDTVLFRHPEFADELRPILEASEKARGMAASDPAADVVHRNRAKILQRAAQMREAKARPSSRIWSVPLRRIAVMLTVIVMLFVSGTGLVRAASSTLPGDNLYPVKRTWEDLLLLFTFNPQERELLEFEHENERLEELRELFAEGRSVKVDFAGYVTHHSATELRVSGISVLISSETRLPAQPIAVGDPVRVRGQTHADGLVHAEWIELLPPGSKLPEVEDDGHETEEEKEQEAQIDDHSNSGSDDGAPPVEEPQMPDEEVEKQTFNGILEAMDDKNQLWTVNGRKLDVSAAEIIGTPVIGAAVKVEGYPGSGGLFVVTKIEIAGSDSVNSGGDDNDQDNNDGNSNDNGNDDDDENDNKNDNKNDNENDNDDDD